MGFAPAMSNYRPRLRAVGLKYEAPRWGYRTARFLGNRRLNSTAAAVGLGVIFGSADGAEVFLTLGTPLQFGVDRWSTPFEI